MKDTISKFLFVILLLALCLPIAQQTGRLFRENPLDGAFLTPVKPLLSSENWLSGTYQDSCSSFFNSAIGFRPFFIRVRNQISFSFFNQSAEADFCIGRNNNFFNSANIASVTGDDFSGIGFINCQMKKLKLIQDSMQARGVPVLFIMAPGKANYFTSDIPKNYKIADSAFTNYYWLSKKLKEYKINHIDFNKYFLQLKDTSQNLLFTKAGLHWSNYGIALSFDSIVKYLKTFNRNNIGDFTIKSYPKSHIPKQADVDQERALNLLLPLRYEEYTYPVREIKKIKGPLPKLLDIGDSFFKCYIDDSIADKFFDYEYFYYFNNVYRNNHSDFPAVEEIDFWNDVFKQQYIIFVSSEGTWNRCGFNFVDILYSYFTERIDPRLISNMNFLLTKIKGKEGWLRHVKFYEKISNNRGKNNIIPPSEIITLESYAEIEYDLHLVPEEQSNVQATEIFLSNSAEVKKIINSMFGNRMRFEKETIHIIACYLQSKNINYQTLAGGLANSNKK